MGMVEWNNDKVQFARLICEILENESFAAGDLCAAMDITEEELEELISRAQNVWEEAKEKAREGTEAKET